MKRESTVVWLHVSSFVVSSEQLEKKIQEAAREKIQNERKCDKKNKKQRKQHLSLTGRKHILKIKIKNQVRQRGYYNVMCKKLQITTHL